MTRKMTYKTLMQKIDDGYAEINAWTSFGEPTLADVTFYKSNGGSKREMIEVTGVPADQER